MRQTKFRGQRHNGSWVYGCLGYSEDISSAIYFQKGAGKIKTMDFIYVKPESVGEFTGLTDKNGADIYEGDIIKSRDIMYSDDKFNVGEVTFKQGGFKIDSVSIHILTMDSAFAPEIIGNIHQDKKLLK